MKSHTDIEQSKKLAEILPIESADMYYDKIDVEIDGGKAIPEVLHSKLCSGDLDVVIPAWSLSALLELIPYYIDVKEGRTIDDNPVTNERYHLHIDRIGLFGDRWKLKYGDTQERQYGKRFIRNYIEYYRTNEYNNLIDATFEMIIWLKENKYI